MFITPSIWWTSNQGFGIACWYVEFLVFVIHHLVSLTIIGVFISGYIPLSSFSQEAIYMTGKTFFYFLPAMSISQSHITVETIIILLTDTIYSWFSKLISEASLIAWSFIKCLYNLCTLGHASSFLVLCQIFLLNSNYWNMCFTNTLKDIQNYKARLEAQTEW